MVWALLSMKTRFNYFSDETRWYDKKKTKIKLGGIWENGICPPNNTRKKKS
jgi:hypothetical protein